MQSENNPPSYNTIFENLVVKTDSGTPERLIGMLAYAEYKLEKHEWTVANPNPSSEAIASFLSHYNERILEKQRTDAENLLLNFAGLYAEGILAEQLEELEEKRLLEELSRVQEDITEKIQKSKTGFGKSVWQSIVASGCFTLFLFVSALILRFAAPKSSAGQLLQYLLSPDQYQLRIEEIKEK